MAIAIALAGCGSPDEPDAAAEGAVEALLEVERGYVYGENTETSHGSAVAQFLLLPAREGAVREETGRDDLLDRAGLRRLIPAPEQCWSTEPPSGRTDPMEPIELLDAGKVELLAGDFLTELAVNGFPLAGAASGVLYSKRDQSAGPLPPASNYLVRVSGSAAVPPLELTAQAPALLNDVAIDGESLGNVAAVAAGEPLALTWTPGEASDRVVLRLGAGDSSVVCAFTDARGAGRLTGEWTQGWPAGEALRLSVHRIREQVSRPASAGSDEGSTLEAMVRFDFAITRTVRVE